MAESRAIPPGSDAQSRQGTQDGGACRVALAPLLLRAVCKPACMGAGPGQSFPRASMHMGQTESVYVHQDLPVSLTSSGGSTCSSLFLKGAGVQFHSCLVWDSWRCVSYHGLAIWEVGMTLKPP